MILKHENDSLGGEFMVTVHESGFNWRQAKADSLIHIIWNDSTEAATLNLDGAPVELPGNSILTVTYYHEVDILDGAEHLNIFSFNREYYCILDHDSEVSCTGILFFGARQFIITPLDKAHQTKLNLLLKVFVDEFAYQDNVQGEMLVMLLKRLIIICTRLTREHIGLNKVAAPEVDLIREFNLLVDMRYKELKSVKEYADLLHKSPKTLSNVFSKAGKRTPLQIIHERVILEARRLLTYTDKSVNEVAYELGFEEPATFFKLFRKYMQETPKSFREKRKNAPSGNLTS